MYNNSHKALRVSSIVSPFNDCLRGIICKKKIKGAAGKEEDNKTNEKIYVDKIPYKLLWFFKHQNKSCKEHKIGSKVPFMNLREQIVKRIYEI